MFPPIPVLRLSMTGLVRPDTSLHTRDQGGWINISAILVQHSWHSCGAKFKHMWFNICRWGLLFHQSLSILSLIEWLSLVIHIMMKYTDCFLLVWLHRKWCHCAYQLPHLLSLLLSLFGLFMWTQFLSVHEQRRKWLRIMRMNLGYCSNIRKWSDTWLRINNEGDFDARDKNFLILWMMSYNKTCFI